MITLKQIAGLAGVSRGTVDRVLHGRGDVNPATAERVLKIAAEQGYTPSRAGRALVTRAPILIGQVVNRMGNPFFDDVLRGMEDAAGDYADFPLEISLRALRGYDVDSQAAALEDFRRRGAKALLLTPINHPRVARAVDALCDAGCPVVAVNTDVENCRRALYVGCDDGLSGRTAGKLMGLMTGGAGRALVVTGSLSLLGHRQRAEGFTAALAEYPLMPPPLIIENGDDEARSFQTVRDALAARPDIDCAYFAAAGAPGGVRAWEASGRRGNHRVIASDATPEVAALVRSGRVSATICQQPYLQGYQAMKAALNLLLFSQPPPKERLYTQSEIKLTYNL